MGINRSKTGHRHWFSMSLSELRHCFVCGGKLALQSIVDDPKKRLVCQRCWHITYTNPKTVTGLIPLMPDGRLVLLRRNIEPALGKWVFPGGYQEVDETTEQAAVRETMEEVAARAKVLGLVGVYSYANSGVVTVVYHGKIFRGEKPRTTPESQEVAFFKRSEIPWKDLAFRSTEEALRDWSKMS